MSLSLARKVPADASDAEKADALDLVTAAATDLERWGRRYWPDYRVHPWVVASDFGIPTSYVPMMDIGNIFQDVLAQEPEGMNPARRMVWGGTAFGQCGIAILGGLRAFTFWACDWGTMSHEGTHMEDVGHSNKQIGDAIQEYGDQLCTMGKKPRVMGFTGLNYRRLGIADKELIVTEPGDYVLGCLETPLGCRHENEWQLLVLPQTDDWRYDMVLSRRKMKGFPHCAGAAYEDTVHVHWEYDRARKAGLTGPFNFQLGETMTMPNGWAVSAIEVNRNQILLRIER